MVRGARAAGTKALSSRVPLVADAEEFVHDVVAVLLREEPTCFLFECVVGPQQLALLGAAVGSSRCTFVVHTSRVRSLYGGRNREVGQGHQVCRSQARMTPQSQPMKRSSRARAPPAS